MQKKIVAMDIGFSAVKALAAGGQKALFPSIVGTPLMEKSFSLNQNGKVISIDGRPAVPVGETALSQAKYKAAPRNSDWVLGQVWETLFMTAVSEFVDAPTTHLSVVTSLPVRNWAVYEAPLRNLYKNREITFQRKGRMQRVIIDDFMVITQPFGALLMRALNTSGQIQDNVFATGNVGIVDIGGMTINMLVSNHLATNEQWTTSDELGLLRALDTVRDAIRDDYPRIRPETQEVSQWVAEGSFNYIGKPIDMTSYVERYVYPVMSAIETKIDESWPEVGRLDAVLFAGGGSITLRPLIKPRLGNLFSQIHLGGRWDNARGSLNLANMEFG